MKRFKKYIVYIGVIVAILSLVLSTRELKDSVSELYPQLTQGTTPSKDLDGINPSFPEKQDQDKNRLDLFYFRNR